MGELYVGGDGLSKGYLNREDLTVNSFVVILIILEKEFTRQVIYAKWLPDGILSFSEELIIN